MNRAQIKCLSVFAIFAVIGFGPVSPGCLIGMYVVIMRPSCFLHLAEGLYSNPMPEALIEPKDILIKAFICLIIYLLLI